MNKKKELIHIYEKKLDFLYNYLKKNITYNGDFFHDCSRKKKISETSYVRYFAMCTIYYTIMKYKKENKKENNKIHEKLLLFDLGYEKEKTTFYCSKFLNYVLLHDNKKIHDHIFCIKTLINNIDNVNIEPIFEKPQLLITLCKLYKSKISLTWKKQIWKILKKIIDNYELNMYDIINNDNIFGANWQMQLLGELIKINYNKKKILNLSDKIYKKYHNIKYSYFNENIVQIEMIASYYSKFTLSMKYNKLEKIISDVENLLEKKNNCIMINNKPLRIDFIGHLLNSLLLIIKYMKKNNNHIRNTDHYEKKYDHHVKIKMVNIKLFIVVIVIIMLILIGILLMLTLIKNKTKTK